MNLKLIDYFVFLV